MKCEIVHKKLILYLNGELNSFENEAVNTHLQNCENCCNLHIELETTLNLIKKKKTLEPNPFLYKRVKQELDSLENEKDRAVFNSVYKKALQPILLSFLMVTGIYLGIILGDTFEMGRQEKLSVLHTTEFYFNDFQQEKLEVFLLNE